MFNGNKYISALIMCQLLRPCTKGKTAAKLKPVHFTFASWLQQRNPPQLLEQLKENTSVHFKKWYQWNLGTRYYALQEIVKSSHPGNILEGNKGEGWGKRVCAAQSAYQELEVLAVL